MTVVRTVRLNNNLPQSAAIPAEFGQGPITRWRVRRHGKPAARRVIAATRQVRGMGRASRRRAAGGGWRPNPDMQRGDKTFYFRLI